MAIIATNYDLKNEIEKLKKQVAYLLSQGGGGGAVSSVFGRAGAVTAQSGDYDFSEIGTTPTTLSGYGITDAQPLDGDLTAIAALVGTGLARKTGVDTWSLDTATYLSSPVGVTDGGTGSTTQFTAGSVVFAGASGVYTQDNTNLFFDNTNNRLGVRTASPQVVFHTVSTEADGYSGYDVNFRAQGNNPGIQLVNAGNTEAWQLDYNTTSGGLQLRSHFGTEYFTITRSAGDFELNQSGAPTYIRLARNGTTFFNTGNVAIGNNSADASAKLDIQSTTQGFLPPRMTQAQREAISSPATGLIVYQTNGTEGLYVKKSGAWALITAI